MALTRRIAGGRSNIYLPLLIPSGLLRLRVEAAALPVCYNRESSLMTRICLVALLAAFVGLGSGCVAVSAKNNRFSDESDVVAVRDRVFVINKRTGRAWEVDIDRASKSPPPAAADESQDKE